VLQPCSLRDWELHVHFHIHGDAKELYGDGLAIWYTKHRLELGLFVFHCRSTLVNTYLLALVSSWLLGAEMGSLICWHNIGSRLRTIPRKPPVYLPCITACTLVFTHSATPLTVFCRRRQLRRQFRWLSCGWHRLLIDYWQKYRIGCHGRKKYLPITILPNMCKYCPIPSNPMLVSFEP